MPLPLWRRARSEGLPPITNIDEFLEQPLACPGKGSSGVGGADPNPVSPKASATCSVSGSLASRQLSPLHVGALEGDFETVVCELVLKGYDIDEKRSLINGNSDLVEGVTPLYLAAQAGNSEMCRLLLRRGADPRLRSSVVRTGESFAPADVALTQGYVRLWWLLRRAAKPHKTPKALKRQASAPLPEVFLST